MPMNFLAFYIIESSAIIGLSAVRLAQLHVEKKKISCMSMISFLGFLTISENPRDVILEGILAI